MKLVSAGELIVTSHLVAASDAFVDPEPDPFTQSVPNGRHPATLAIADYGTDERVAFARVQFSRLPIESWKMAVTSRAMNPATLGPGKHFGYVVDAGTGSFMDPAAGKLFAARCRSDDDFLDDIGKLLDTQLWANTRPDVAHEENVICFSSGFGDGSYPSFFGFDATGEVCQLVTDFGLFYEAPLETPGAKRWWQFWR